MKCTRQACNAAPPSLPVAHDGSRTQTGPGPARGEEQRHWTQRVAQGRSRRHAGSGDHGSRVTQKSVARLHENCIGRYSIRQCRRACARCSAAANLSGPDFREDDSPRRNSPTCDFSKSDLRGENHPCTPACSRARFDEADLRRRFRAADLRGATFDRADADRLPADGADLREGAILRSVRLGEAERPGQHVQGRQKG